MGQILTSNTGELQANYEYIREVNQRVNPAIFTQDLKVMTRIIAAYDDLLTFSIRQVWHRHNSVLLKVEQALDFLLEGILARDLEHTFIGSIDLFKEAFKKGFGLQRRTVHAYADRVMVDFDILLSLLEPPQHNPTASASKLDDHLRKSRADMNILSDAIGRYYTLTLLTPSSTSLGTHYPQSRNHRTSQPQCHTVALMFVPKLNRTLNLLAGARQSELFPINATFPTPSEIARQTVDLEPMMEELLSCVDEYHTFLQRISLWKDSVLSVKNTILGNMSLTTQGVTVDNYLDYVEETQHLTTTKNELNSAFQMYTSGAISKLDMAKKVLRGSSEQTVQDASRFASRVKLRLFEVLRDRIGQVASFVSNTYLDLIRKEIIFAEFLGSNFKVSLLQGMRIWARPEANILDADSPKYANDKYTFKNIQSFASVNMDKVMQGLLSWYTLSIREALDRTDKEFSSRHQSLTAMLLEVNRHYTKYVKETDIGVDFVK